MLNQDVINSYNKKKTYISKQWNSMLQPKSEYQEINVNKS